jgi:hypothetical protein
VFSRSDLFVMRQAQRLRRPRPRFACRPESPLTRVQGEFRRVWNQSCRAGAQAGSILYDLRMCFFSEVEEAPEARKFSKDLWASSFVLPSVCVNVAPEGNQSGQALD